MSYSFFALKSTFLMGTLPGWMACVHIHAQPAWCVHPVGLLTNIRKGARAQQCLHILGFLTHIHQLARDAAVEHGWVLDAREPCAENFIHPAQKLAPPQEISRVQ